MKNFNHLNFKPHPNGRGVQAKMFFKNGYGVSVVRFKVLESYGSYTNNESEWELAVLEGKNGNWKLCYDTHITNDVIGYLSDSDVTEIMEQVQKLPKIR